MTGLAVTGGVDGPKGRPALCKASAEERTDVMATVLAREGLASPDTARSLAEALIVALAAESDRRWVLERVSEDTSGCWLWTLHTNADGYAQTVWRGKSRRMHRVAYELFVGPIPEGLVLDHLCRVRHCLNPKHLEPVTGRENVMRGEGVGAKCARRTHCPAGHPLDNSNRDQRGSRVCLPCRRDYLRRNSVRINELRRARGVARLVPTLEGVTNG